MSNAKAICMVCDYIYDEGVSEPSKCPECGSGKECFQICSCVGPSLDEQTCIAHRSNGHSADVAKLEPAPSRIALVGELVAQRQSRAGVLEQYGIDYCCGGKSTLEEACQKKGLNVEEVLEKLIASDQKGTRSDERDWTTTSLKVLVDHIITTYHLPLRQELSRIALLAQKVANVHGDSHPEMIEVMNLFNRFKVQLELHMQKEEMVLFPGIIAMEETGTPQIFGCGGGIEHPIEMMTLEHDEAGEALRSMRTLTNEYTPPEDACSTFKVLLYCLDQFESEMHQHVHKENNILFPRALQLPQLEATSRHRK